MTIVVDPTAFQLGNRLDSPYWCARNAANRTRPSHSANSASESSDCTRNAVLYRVFELVLYES
jgi:hypothetical protein